MNRLSAFAVIASAWWSADIPRPLLRPQRRVLLSQGHTSNSARGSNSMGRLASKEAANHRDLSTFAGDQQSKACAGWCGYVQRDKTYRGKFLKFSIRRRLRSSRLAMPQRPSRIRQHSRRRTSPATFHVFSPQWAGEAPGIALDTQKEVE